MSNRELLAGRPSGKPAGMRVIDVDIHVSDPPQALLPYIDSTWRESLSIISQGRQGYVDIPGYAPGGLKADPKIPGGHKRRSVDTKAEMREELDLLGIDEGVMLPDNLLNFASLQHPEYATALGRAYNRWLTTEWVDASLGLYGAVLAAPQNPQDAVKEIERYASTPGVIGVFLPTAGVSPLWGHRQYNSIMAAAEAAGLPVIFHSVGFVGSAFPHNQEQFENHFGRWVLNHAFGMMANLSSLMHTGVPARFPKLRFAFTEAGIAWVPMMKWRMDRAYNELRKDVPTLKELPSVYMKEQMWFGTQPFEEPAVKSQYVETVVQTGEDNVIFCSDWPHHDFDHPSAVFSMPMSAEQKLKIMGENAVRLFNLPALTRQIPVHAEKVA
jgi:predicted TIM-barrel fold metal-dependent hydrolase